MKKLAKLFIVSLLSLGFISNAFATISSENISYLFVQSAQSASLIANNDEPGTYTLTLKNVNPYVTSFSDRPNRVMKLISVEEFMNSWLHSPAKNSFKNNPPNVDFNGMLLGHKQPINLPLEISNPNYDSHTNSLTFSAKKLKGSVTIPQKLEANYVTLVIDDFCTTCPD